MASRPRVHHTTRANHRLAASVAIALLVAAARIALLAAPTSFLWKVSNSQNAVYLLGSVHMLTSDYYPLNAALESAYADSSLLVEEVDMGELLSPQSQMLLLSRGMLPSGQTLDRVLSASTYAQVSRHVESLGLPMDPLKMFKPWSLAMMVLGLEWQRAGFDPNLGIDKHFYDRAQSEGKRTEGLETVEYQVARFDEMTMPQQERLLTESLKGLKNEQANVATIARAWKTGDSATLERIVLQDMRDDPVVYQRLLLDRNRNWLPKIEALFGRQGHALVVVGAAHLIGPDGLLAMLQSKGYAVEQM